MDKIEERAKEYADRHQKLNNFGIGKVYEYPRIYTSEKFAYEAGAREQKAIDNKEINALYSIMEQSASVLGIGTMWLNENARQVAIAELREKILNYLKEYT